MIPFRSESIKVYKTVKVIGPLIGLTAMLRL
jgi:hypothetical protein